MSRPLLLQYEPVEIHTRVSTLLRVSRERAAIYQQHEFRVLPTHWRGTLAFVPTGLHLGPPGGGAA